MKKYVSTEEAKGLMDKYCPFLEKSDLDFADFKFKNIVDALSLASFMDSFIPLTQNVGLEIKDVGSGDGAPQFEHPLRLIYFSPEPEKTRYRGTTFVNFMSGQRAAPINMSTHNFLMNYPDFTEKQFHLVFDRDGSKTAEVLKRLNDYNFVVIQSTSDTVGEDFFEYMGALHFKQKGYFVTKWHPLFGCDFFAYKIPEYQRELQRRGHINGGAFLTELDIPRRLRENKQDVDLQLQGYDVIALEAESCCNLATNSRTGVGQKVGLASSTCEVYGVGPTTYHHEGGREGLCSSFGKRAGALLFYDLEKFELEPMESGFTEEAEVIKRMKVMMKSVLASRLTNMSALNVKKISDFPERLAKIELAELLDILES